MYGSFLSSVRRARGLTQVQLAEIAGIEQANISAIERDRRQPSAATMHRLLHTCGFELTASAGGRAITCRPPDVDHIVDQLLLEGRPTEPAIVTRDTPMETRVRVINAVLDASEAVLRAR